VKVRSRALSLPMHGHGSWLCVTQGTW
jgi:hypothetical protein